MEPNHLIIVSAYLFGLGTWGLVSFVFGLFRACRHCKTPWWPWEPESFHAPDCPSLEFTTGPETKSPLIDEQLTDLTVEALRKSRHFVEDPCDGCTRQDGCEEVEPCPDFVKANTEPDEEISESRLQELEEIRELIIEANDDDGERESDESGEIWSRFERLFNEAAWIAKRLGPQTEPAKEGTIAEQAREIDRLKAALKEHNARILSGLSPEFQRAAAAMMQTAIDQVEASLYSKEGMDPPKRFAPLPKLVIDDDGRHPLAAVAARIASEATETADKPRPNPCLDPDKMLGAADQFSGHEYPGEYEIDPVASIEVFDRFVFEGKIETRITESPEALEKCNTCHEPADFEVHMVVLERGETTTRRRTACREHLADHVSTEVPSDVYPLEKTSGPPEDLPF